MSFGSALKLCRSQRHMTQAELAAKCNLSTNYISLIEGDHREPSLTAAHAIADAIGVPLSILFFLGTDRQTITDISPDTAEKLAATLLKLIGEVK